MKKTLMIALAGMMLFAFTQCDDSSNGSKKDGDNTETKISGSKEYQNYAKGFDEIMNVVKNAKDCDRLQEDVARIEAKYDNKFDEKDRMTEDEESKLDKTREKFMNLLMEKIKELGCDDFDF